MICRWKRKKLQTYDAINRVRIHKGAIFADESL